MYKVFVNNTPIILSTKKSIEDYEMIPIKEASFPTIIRDILSKEAIHEEAKYHLYHKKEDKLIEHLYSKLPVVVAGGGKVYNENKEILFIRRNGKWDLPKGKVEKKEDMETAAMREVEEETGVSGLEITKFLYRSYHIFKRNGEFRLKVTYWFEMKTKYSGELVPQKNEGITKVRWKNTKKAKKALQDSYSNIKLLFSHDYLS
ncbi:8-oxo-dGTP pyrophosphatase MutT (NUDIX family) [Aquimarina sp. EL_43]|uniref:NUDIX hydrolase n=1 Tax=Aquimarina TaxID=290174 RepID=UPI00047114AF|nr:MULTISPECIES: NUDIX domain-containing protein [Aquimarina]MBG6130911.1 8-oxo-dGTP pyrophosphatase MutT (NUDIX family) [Aquimarina sp. EL_35]MBG6151370.1 8-oxo-dGTP pyrophosphatase MutT (NUDIX family) [Aquimarina sp. EL_32]MBG6169301.1 8-oxo-dGTP pyrophosphatase MutT (NUDIX family) [Aquimarina sp. EL_43]